MRTLITVLVLVLCFLAPISLIGNALADTPQQPIILQPIVITQQLARVSGDLKPADFNVIYDMVTDAAHLDDLKPVLTERYFVYLKDKVKSGISQYMVLAMVQALRPSKVRFLESHFDQTKAEVSVVGDSIYGQMQGLIHLLKHDGAWKVDDESWFVEGALAVKENNLDVKEERVFLSKGQNRSREMVGLLKRVSPDYQIKNSLLSLTKVSQGARKESLNFVFLMNKEKVVPNGAKGIGKVNKKDKSMTFTKTDKPSRLHMLWTGSSKFLKNQKIVDDEYPIDFSVAKYDDGYASDEWNLVLPNKKPREIAVSLMWTF